MTTARTQPLHGAEGGSTAAEAPFRSSAEGADSGPRVHYVDWADMERRMSARRAVALLSDQRARPRSRRRRFVTTVEAQVDQVRRNVQDSARAVLTWLAAVSGGSSPQDLEQVLSRCLRPGPDVSGLNYTALAEQIEQTTGLRLSPKRVRTAVEHLRNGGGRTPESAKAPAMSRRLDALQGLIESNLEELSSPGQKNDERLRESVAIDVLATVRCAAGRLIENDYGEGIPDQVDLDQLEGRLLSFVRDVKKRAACATGSDLERELHALLVALCDYDGSGEADMRLVVEGSRVVTGLAGAGSMPGLMAQLNVYVAGRDLLETPVYVAQMRRLADAAAALHADEKTTQFMGRVRRLEQDKRLPSPLRLSSFCLNNAATRILERLFKGELKGRDRWLSRARAFIEQMAGRDSGFRLIKTTEMIYQTVAAKLSGDATAVTSHVAELGADAALSVIEDMARFDNCAEIVHAAENHVVAAFADLRHQLICLG